MTLRNLFEKRSAPVAFDNPDFIRSQLRNGYTSAGVVVTSQTAIRMSTVYACIRLLADTISSLPLGAYVRRGRVRLGYGSVYNEYPLWLNRPNSETNLLEFIEQIISSMEIDGNAFLFTVRDDYGDVQEIWVLNPRQVTITRPVLNGPLVYRITSVGGVLNQNFLPGVYSSDEILHIPLFKLPGQFYGLSPIAACRATLGSAKAAEDQAAASFANGSTPGGALELPGTPEPTEILRMTDSWNIDHQGPYNANKVTVLTGGAKFTPLSINSQDAQLLETRQFNVEEIARLFRVPLNLIGHPIAGAMSYASVEANNLAFVQHTLRPLLERIERALSTLLPHADGFLKFNLDALLRGTTTERFDNYAKGQQNGWLSVNDIHSYEDMPPIGDAGDVYRVPLQNIDIEDAPDVGLDLRSKIILNLVNAGYEPDAVIKAVGMEPIKHTGLPPIRLQQVQNIDPNDPSSVYSVK